MSDFVLNQTMDGTSGGPIQPASRPNLDKGFNPLTMIIFFGILAAGLLFVAYSIYVDVDATGAKVTTYLPYLLLMVALLIALGFEFVNGFHDTANAVATGNHPQHGDGVGADVTGGDFDIGHVVRDLLAPVLIRRIRRSEKALRFARAFLPGTCPSSCARQLTRRACSRPA